MQPLPKILTALALPLVLMGCDPYHDAPIQDRIELSTSEAVMSYRFTTGGTQLTSADQRKLRRLLAEIGPNPQDRIVVSLPAGATAAQTQARETHLRGLLATSRAQVSVIGDSPNQRRTSVSNQGMIRIIRAHQLSVACPANDGLPSGCSQSRNLAAMLADPNDLILPRELQPGRGRPKLAAEAPQTAATGTATPARGTARPAPATP